MRARSTNQSEPFPALASVVEAREFERLLGDGAVFGMAAESAEAAPMRPAPPSATFTLAELYLAQGHREEARRVLDQLLERQPGHPAGRRLADRIERRGRRLSATDLLDDPAVGASLERRKRLLEAYAQRLHDAAARERGS